MDGNAERAAAVRASPPLFGPLTMAATAIQYLAFTLQSTNHSLQLLKLFTCDLSLYLEETTWQGELTIQPKQHDQRRRSASLWAMCSRSHLQYTLSSRNMKPLMDPPQIGEEIVVQR